MVSALLGRMYARKAQSGARLGIALGEGEVAVALVRREGVDRPVIEHCERHACSGGATETLRTVIDGLHAGRAPACVVLDSNDYQIVQVEAPGVLPAELRAALRWRLKDMIAFDVEDATIDAFEIPEAARRGQGQMLFAVAARTAVIQRVSATIKPAVRGFDAIDIPELCLRNIGVRLPQDERGVAMLALQARFAQLVVMCRGVVYVTRRIDLARGVGLSLDEVAQPEIDAAALALELQRSLDYYEGHFDQAPIGDLVIVPDEPRTRALAVDLKGESSLRAAVLDLRESFGMAPGPEPTSSWLAVMALGAALHDAPAE